MNNNEDNLDRKLNRRKKFQDKNFKKKEHRDEEYNLSKKSKYRVKEHKEDLQNEEWEDWDRYYNH